MLARAAFFPPVRNMYRFVRRMPGAGRISRSLARRAVPAGTRYWVEVPDGIDGTYWLSLDPRYELSYAGARYEPETQTVLRTTLKRGDVFYDVGAHIGFFSLLAARLVGTGGKVVSLEPDPDNFRQLGEHIARNGVPQVRAVNAAAWSRAGSVAFHRAAPRSSGNRGAVTAAGSAADAPEIEVTAVTLDDLADAHGQPAMIKIDVEGGEIEVLKGAAGLLATRRPAVLCEIHSPANWDAFRAALADLPYSIRPLTGADAVPFHVLAWAR